MDFGNWRECSLEDLKSDKYTISKERDENGRYVVEGNLDALLKDLHCLSLEDANRRLFNLIGDKDKLNGI